MANLRNITELPFAESAEGLNLIVNDGGAAKQIAASAVGAQADWNETDENSPSFIQNKPTVKKQGKELIYELNFDISDYVCESLFNIDVDLSWLEKDNYEIVIEQYGIDGSTQEAVDMVIHSILSPTSCNAVAYTNLPENEMWEGSPLVLCLDKWPPNCYVEINGQSNSSEIFLQLIKNRHIDENYMVTEAVGGFIYIVEQYDCPFKSIKLYKID